MIKYGAFTVFKHENIMTILLLFIIIKIHRMKIVINEE